MSTRTSKVYLFFLLVLLIFSFLIRLIGWDDPSFGDHIFRQLYTLNNIENYMREGIKLLEPSGYYLWDNRWSHQTVINGGSIVWEHPLQELPIYQALSAWISGFTKTVLSTSRSINLFFSLLTLFVVFQIAITQFNRETAIYSVLFFAFSPLNLIYQSAVLFDISTIFFASLSYWIVAIYIQGKCSKILLFIFLFAGLYSVLTKPLYFLPTGVLIATHFIQQWKRPRTKNLLDYFVRHQKIIGLFVLITLVMFFWVGVQKQVNSSSYNSFKFLSLQHFYDLIFYVRILFRGTLLILNPITFLFFILGILLLLRHHRGSERMALIYSIIWYHLMFGTQVNLHDYYELIMVPYASVIAGFGATWIEEKMRSEFQATPIYMFSGGIIIATALCSFFLYSINFIGNLKIEHRTDNIKEEMQGLLEPQNYAYVYIDQTNFPIDDYMIHNRTAKLMYFSGLLSKNEIRLQSDPLVPIELMIALKQYGVCEWIKSGRAPDINIQEIELSYKKNLRYLMFYRFTEKTKAVIKSQIIGSKLIYDSSTWLIYDLALEL